MSVRVRFGRDFGELEVTPGTSLLEMPRNAGTISPSSIRMPVMMT